jgi:dTDP-4-amino-4,6-dideoxygalactose transaminase
MIPIARPQLGAEEETAVLEVMRSGMLAQGPQVRAFEEAFATAMGSRFAVATSNGTTALYLALLAHGVGPGDEVITSPMTFIATANAIVQTGARPVFADVDDSLNLDPDAAAAMIGPLTRAIVPVHLHGNPCDLSAFIRMARENGLFVIQDACQAVGATIDGQPLGSFGTAVYSFYATKNLTTGEGGMVATNDETVVDACRRLRNQAYSQVPYMHDAVAYNFRMTEIQAAIGRVQLAKLSAITRSRRENALYYDQGIPDDRFGRPRRDHPEGHVYHQYTLRTRRKGRLSRDALLERLQEAGVATGVYYPVPVHKQPPYQRSDAPPCHQAEMAAAEIFSIPVHPGLSGADRARVVEAVVAL